jgi:hypothetical protein
MTNVSRSLGVEPRDTIRWKGARRVLDHCRRRRKRDAFAFTVKVNKGTRT